MYIYDRVGKTALLIEACDISIGIVSGDNGALAVEATRDTVLTSKTDNTKSMIDEAQCLVCDIAEGFDKNLSNMSSSLDSVEIEMALSLSANFKTWIINMGNEASIKVKFIWKNL